MKSNQLRRSTLLVLTLAAFSISSFGPEAKKKIYFCDNGELGIVSAFVRENICLPISQVNPSRPGGQSIDLVSYCPSGYGSVFTINENLVTTDRFVSGKILLYKDCSSQRVCDFKVCVARNFIMLKSDATGQYLSVSNWIKYESRKGNGNGC